MNQQAAEVEKGLDYYMEHPDELPEHYSLEQLEAMANGSKVPEVAAEAEKGEAQSETDGATDGTEAKPEQTPEGDAKVDDQKAEEPEGEAPIESKNGKHTIPYAVLQKEREQRMAAETAIQELRGRLEALEKGESQSADVSGILSAEEISALREDFPALADTFEKLIDKVGALETQLSKGREEQQQEQQLTAEQEAQRIAQEAIDANPTLSHWQTSNDPRFAAAVEIDNLLRVKPENAGLSVDDRFVKVVAAVEAIHGKTDLPEPHKKEEPQKNTAEKAKKIADEAGEFEPRTISDLPGGQLPASSEADNVAAMSATEMAATMEKMTPDQISQFIAKYG